MPHILGVGQRPNECSGDGHGLGLAMIHPVTLSNRVNYNPWTGQEGTENAPASFDPFNICRSKPDDQSVELQGKRQTTPIVAVLPIRARTPVPNAGQAARWTKAGKAPSRRAGSEPHNPRR